jgi:hypothetical protein
MSKKKKPLNVLMIDDSAEAFATIRLDAQEIRISLDHAESLEAAKEKIKTKGSKYYAGVILDIKGLTTKAQEVEDASFLGESLKFFQREEPALPIVILTGQPKYIDVIKETHGSQYRVYLKGSDKIEEMLCFIRERGENLDYIRITESYPDVFEVFSMGYLDSEAEQFLIACIGNLKSKDSVVIGSNFKNLRLLQEKIFRRLIREKIIPDKTEKTSKHSEEKYFIDKDGRISTTIILGYLRYTNVLYEGKSFINNYGYLISSIGTKGSHSSSQDHPTYQPTKYTNQASIFAMMDLLLWFKGVMEKSGVQN